MTTSKPSGERETIARTFGEERAFFLFAACWFLLLTFAGFAYPFYLNLDPAPLPTHLILHGWLFTLWVLVFFAQTMLVRTQQLTLHKALGAAAIILLLAMIPASVYPVLHKVSEGTKTVDHAGFNLATLCLGFAFALTAIGMRANAFAHKRLMLFATLVFCVAAADRVSMIIMAEDVRSVRKSLALAPGVALLIYDLVQRRRIPTLTLALLLLTALVIVGSISDMLFTQPLGHDLMFGWMEAIGLATPVD